MKGIYKITHIPTSKIYIGSSKNTERRWKEHIAALKKNKHHSWKLQETWNRSKKEKNFKFEVIEVVDNPDDLFKREQYYLDLYKSYDSNNFNVLNKAGEIPNNINFDKIKKKEQYYLKKQQYNEIKNKLLDILKEYNINCIYEPKKNFEENAFRLNREINQINFTIKIITSLINNNIKPFKLKSKLSLSYKSITYYTVVDIYVNENLYISIDNVALKDTIDKTNHNIDKIINNLYNLCDDSFLLCCTSYKELLNM